MSFIVQSTLPDVFLVGVITVEGTHAPIVLKVTAPFPVFVDLPEKKFALNHQHALVAHLTRVYSLSMLFVYELCSISAFSTLQQKFVSFVLIDDVAALGKSFY